MPDKKQELEEIVGAGNVLDDSDTLDNYSKDYSFTRLTRPLFLVRPKNEEEIQGIVKWANHRRMPLVPISSGPPHFHGDTVATATGAVIIELTRMNRIVKIDPQSMIALIEPGVTYGQLQPELSKEGMRLSTPLVPRLNKSVLTSLLEREPTLIPKNLLSILDPLRCLNIIWGDGQMLNTGGAESISKLEEKWRPPVMAISQGQAGFHRFVSAAQGSMGIVTWASVKCEVLPKVYKLFLVPSSNLEDLFDFTYKLLKFRFGDELLLLNRSNLAYILGDGVGQITALRKKLPAWVAVIGIAGRNRLPKERVEFQEKDITDIAQQFGLKLISAVPGASASEVMEVILNPSKEPYWKIACRGGCQDIFFLTTLNRTSEFVKIMYSVSETYGYSSSEIGVYIQPIHQGVGCHCEFDLPFDRNNPLETNRIHEIYFKASEELLRRGAYFSRPYGIWANMAYNRDVDARTLLKKTKGIFDPNNVMNPGKLCF